MVVDEQLFKRALGRWPSGVTVVTAVADGVPTGMTASSFTSVSLDPPLVSVCVDHAARSLAALQSSRRFAVSILARNQADVSQRFASRLDEHVKFEVPTLAGVFGCPLIVGAAAHVECETFSELVAGDHTLLVGKVLHVAVHDVEPLLYWSGQYGSFAPA
jgi:flavin reductase (DIM6/NTAB) family NADH-FMN oxidoreductase RutF